MKCTRQNSDFHIQIALHEQISILCHVISSCNSVTSCVTRLETLIVCILDTVIAAGHQPVADHILDPFEIFGSMVRWFHGPMV